MTTFEIAQNIQRIITTCASETMLYNSWGDEFATKNIRDIPGRIKQLPIQIFSGTREVTIWYNIDSH